MAALTVPRMGFTACMASLANLWGRESLSPFSSSCCAMSIGLIVSRVVLVSIDLKLALRGFIKHGFRCWHAMLIIVNAVDIFHNLPFIITINIHDIDYRRAPCVLDVSSATCNHNSWVFLWKLSQTWMQAAKMVHSARNSVAQRSTFERLLILSTHSRLDDLTWMSCFVRGSCGDSLFCCGKLGSFSCGGRLSGGHSERKLEAKERPGHYWLRKLQCPFDWCSKTFSSTHGRTYHVRTKHSTSNVLPASVAPRLDGPQHGKHVPATPSRSQSPTGPQMPEGLGWNPGLNLTDKPDNGADRLDHSQPGRRYHPFLTGRPCDQHGVYLEPDTPPSPPSPPPPNDWSPFDSEQQFELADLLFRKVEMSASNIDEILRIWALGQSKTDVDMDSENGSTGEPCEPGPSAPFSDHNDLYDTIDASTLGDAPWQCIEVLPPPPELGSDEPDANKDSEPLPQWKGQVHEIWYRDPNVVLRNMLGNPDFDGEFDYAPYVDIDKSGKRRWGDFMSGNFAWRHSVSALLRYYINVSLTAM
ncbi:hypothetical protein AB1N83_009101 [Pleurotus pulmonarius]